MQNPLATTGASIKGPDQELLDYTEDEDSAQSSKIISMILKTDGLKMCKTCYGNRIENSNNCEVLCFETERVATSTVNKQKQKKVSRLTRI